MLHHEGDYFIQALTWMEGTTAIHDHAFCGAFMVLEGASLHVTYGFRTAERLAEDRLVVGDLARAAGGAPTPRYPVDRSRERVSSMRSSTWSVRR